MPMPCGGWPWGGVHIANIYNYTMEQLTRIGTGFKLNPGSIDHS